MVYYSAAAKTMLEFNQTNNGGIMKFINRFLFGGSYKVAHIDAVTGKRKVFWCDTWQDAIEWVSCALNADSVTVTDTSGFVLAQRRGDLICPRVSQTMLCTNVLQC